MREWESERMGEWKCENERVWQWSIAIFGYKQWFLSIHMKTKGVQRERVNERMRVRDCDSVRVSFEYKLDMKTKVVQNIQTFLHSWFPAFVWRSDIFSWEPALWTHESQDRVSMMWSKKSIAIFSNKQRLLSLDMKTKLVQHVESDWMRDWNLWK